MENLSSSALFSGGLSDSRRLPAEKLGQMPDIIRKAVARVNSSLSRKQDIDLEIIRVDSFLALSPDTTAGLRLALMLLTAIKINCSPEHDEPCNIKIALATGPVEYRQKSLRESDGTAIRLAMEAYEKMGKGQRLIVVTGDKKKNEYFRVICGFMDTLISGWSVEQAEALYLSLDGMLQSEISKKLNVSQPAVNRRLKAAQWNAVELFIKLYEKSI